MNRMLALLMLALCVGACTKITLIVNKDGSVETDEPSGIKAPRTFSIERQVVPHDGPPFNPDN